MAKDRGNIESDPIDDVELNKSVETFVNNDLKSTVQKYIAATFAAMIAAVVSARDTLRDGPAWIRWLMNTDWHHLFVHFYLRPRSVFCPRRDLRSIIGETT
ncbi:MAG: hypothetical protein ACRECO_21090 [Xanthobacteraceae bacterium]